MQACGRRWCCRPASRCRLLWRGLLPVFDTGYWLSIGVSIAMYTVLATSWTLFSGPTKYIALSTAAFFGIGMYVVGAGLTYVPFPVLVALPASLAAVLAASSAWRRSVFPASIS